MHELLLIGTSIIERGLIFGIVIMGMYITSRILRFDDLTLEGSFGLGGALTALCLAYGMHPIVSICLAICAGAIAGAMTTVLHTQLQFNQLMSGVIVTTALFSVSLKIAGANKPLLGNTLFTLIPVPFATLILLTIIAGALLYLISWFLKTEMGYVLRATGANKQMVRMLGKKVNIYILLGLTLSNMLNALTLSNMLNALAGSLFVQYVGFYSIWNNIGVLIIALAGLILAETFNTNFGPALLMGSFLYQAIIVATFELQLDQDWNKMITALLIVALIAWKKWHSGPHGEKTC
jgi:putative ABC transport system permease protein